MRSKNMSKKSRIGIISILSLTIILSTIGFNNIEEKGTCQVVPFLMCKREKTQNSFLFAY